MLYNCEVLFSEAALAQNHKDPFSCTIHKSFDVYVLIHCTDRPMIISGPIWGTVPFTGILQ
jgi:hypothetical protein